MTIEESLAFKIVAFDFQDRDLVDQLSNRHWRINRNRGVGTHFGEDD